MGSLWPYRTGIMQVSGYVLPRIHLLLSTWANKSGTSALFILSARLKQTLMHSPCPLTCGDRRAVIAITEKAQDSTLPL
jgi:hypothetical protein